MGHKALHGYHLALYREENCRHCYKSTIPGADCTAVKTLVDYLDKTRQTTCSVTKSAFEGSGFDNLVVTPRGHPRRCNQALVNTKNAPTEGNTSSRFQ